MTYLLLNTFFVVISLIIFIVRVKRSRWATYGVSMLLLLLMTAIFDNAIIASGIVAYDESKISGLMIGLAPIEDFAYAIVAVLAVGAIKR